ncbi:MAG: DUF1499 domain-containing protein [Gammaproteobacteria bacterium]|nr:DUF1499 domain-containing protein [Gammaproteobacteria bacterium]
MAGKLAYGIAAVAVVALLAFAALAVYSRRAPQLGMTDGQLRPCPERPNCVCSEAGTANIEPLRLAQSAPLAWERFTGMVAASGGRIQQLNNDYLHATFESTYFRFIDDFEARIDYEASVIHVRSASRVGYGDRGVNRNRVEKLRTEHRGSGAGS